MNQEILEDEIDLRELFNTINKNRVKIFILTLIITSLAVIYALSIPNSYKSQTILVPQTEAKPSLGGLSALAGMARVDLGGSGQIDAATSFETILKDYSFEQYMIEKYNLIDKFTLKQENLVFALSFDGFYNMFHFESSEDSVNEDSVNIEEKTYSTYQKILTTLSISTDKKSGLITLSAESIDRFLSKELVEIYLVELTNYLRKTEMQNVDKQIKFYKNEFNNIADISIKTQLGNLAAGLLQKKVLAEANEYYNVKQLTKPQVAYIRDKTKPKRSLIVIVAFITSIILGIFAVFFLEFIRSEDIDKK